jgi:aryl-alcohol dehydrogenase-like predicted oxidoreductase
VINKIIIGTVNFGQKKYGISSPLRIANKEINKIFKEATKNNIYSFDTAINYKNSHKILSKHYRKNKLYITTKIPSLSKIKTLDLSKKIEFYVTESLKDLSIKKIDNILFHDPRDLFLIKRCKIIKQVIVKLKNDKIVNKFGVSIYNKKELDKVLLNWKPDVVQLPLNIFDRRVLSDKYLNFLKKKNILIQARSIFLQGLLLNKRLMKLKKFNRWRNLFKLWNSWLISNKISALQACINFIRSLKNIDMVVFGVNNVNHLKEIINCFRSNNKNFPKNLFSNDKNLLEPNRW